MILKSIKTWIHVFTCEVKKSTKREIKFKFLSLSLHMIKWVRGLYVLLFVSFVVSIILALSIFKSLEYIGQVALTDSTFYFFSFAFFPYLCLMILSGMILALILKEKYWLRIGGILAEIEEIQDSLLKTKKNYVSPDSVLSHSEVSREIPASRPKNASI